MKIICRNAITHLVGGQRPLAPSHPTAGRVVSFQFIHDQALSLSGLPYAGFPQAAVYRDSDPEKWQAFPERRPAAGK
jgi:hypothetical protein